MGAKKIRNDISAVRNELRALSEAVWALREQVMVQSAAAAATGQHAHAPVIAITDDLHGDGARGTVVSRGVVRDALGGREYRWDTEVDAGALLAGDDALVSQVLAAIGHRQRLAILKAILNAPATVADLVRNLDLGTTGAAYHHLKVLQAAGLVTQEVRGTFEIAPDRIATIFAILAGIESAASAVVVDTPAADEVEDEPVAESSNRKSQQAA